MEYREASLGATSSDGYATAQESERSPSVGTEPGASQGTLPQLDDATAVKLSTLLLDSVQPASDTPKIRVYIQPDCTKHKYVRTPDSATIVERPERLKACHAGVAGAWAFSRGDPSRPVEPVPTPTNPHSVSIGAAREDADASLDALMNRLSVNNATSSQTSEHSLSWTETLLLDTDPFEVILSSASLPLTDTSVQHIHGGLEANEQASTSAYPSDLIKWIEACRAITPGESEIPAHLSQGDLYLCPGSLDAIQGALGATCQAIDHALASAQPESALVLVRPPGHHCGQSSPSGFCFVNTVLIGAAHAFHRHNINRVILLDQDLHHGNGSQDIAFRLNAEANALLSDSRKTTPTTSPLRSKPAKHDPLRVFYGSLHDVMSYPCEDGDPDRVQAASVTLAGPHGQWISNAHLDEYSSETDFHERLYPCYRSALIGAAERFIEQTDAEPSRTLVLVSAGFDASQHEYSSMQRHNRRVPTSFFSRFAVDAASFAKRFAAGKLVSVLEGGYSDTALCSGVAAYLTGLVSHTRDDQQAVMHTETPWDPKTLAKLEKTCFVGYKQAGRRATLQPHQSKDQAAAPEHDWLKQAAEAFAVIQGRDLSTAYATSAAAAPSSMSLRERKPKAYGDAATPPASPRKAQRAVSARATPVFGSRKLDQPQFSLAELEKRRQPKPLIFTSPAPWQPTPPVDQPEQAINRGPEDPTAPALHTATNQPPPHVKFIWRGGDAP
ncbi:uncharacterized protein L969DRAFT_15246 [Mixia osmundae IAM 14324]|uniref:Histone deacetylase domain-containing protein n=1 Tax=Mixia osmundae (strain CBS 9802 / IAM 14324 / JCM 22182 / KY 12970) TaxID=764103 RepID=G7DXH0_MIXOS|nr:uncharacterized protein L969DRAFT_15246 [Mixia osmundae IAM 14324]KEI41226.1 hypothetical protein L969DRAFT_15246 [Mixia osmundae IAM 14324]GAA95280.1 hypothetical protein E5Q_01936 [Mixia osmundae IAM 14324]